MILLNLRRSLSTEISSQVDSLQSVDTSLEAQLSSDIDSLADVDNATISLDSATNTIRLKEEIAAPDSGMYTFNSSVEVSDTLTVDGVDVMAAIKTEKDRAEEAEHSLEVALSTEVSYLIANTDLTSIDSFAEVSDAVSSVETNVDNLSINTEDYVINNRPCMIGFNEAPDGTNTVFTANVESGTQLIFLNGLVQLIGFHAGEAIANPGVLTVEFDTAPESTDVIDIYGVPHGISFEGVNDASQENVHGGVNFPQQGDPQ
jgi:hypothetical protein